MKQLQDKYGEGTFQEEINASTMIAKYLLARELRVRKEIPINVTRLTEYTGIFELLPVPLKFYIEGNKFMVAGPIISQAELFAETDNRFFIKIANAQFEFIRNKEGKIDECILYLDGNKYICKKL